MCTGNDFLKFGMALSFCGPLLALSKIALGGGFLFHGNTSIGKSTTCLAAASAWGEPLNYTHSFNATLNGVEHLAFAHNAGLLILDELQQANADIVDEISYTIINGKGKAKSTKEGALDFTKSWSVVFMCTGEETLAKRLQECGKRKKAGEEVRVSGILMPDDHIKNLHQYSSSYEFIEAIRNGFLNNYGIAGREYLSILTEPSELQKVKKELPQEVDKIMVKLCQPYNVSPPIKRVAKFFALIGYSAKLAAKYGILPPTFERMKYIRTCFEAWLQECDFVCKREIVILKHVYDFFNKYGESRFCNFHEAHTHGKECYGYTGCNCRGCASSDYLMSSDSFKDNLCGGFDPKEVKDILYENNLLRHDKGRKQKKIVINGQEERMYVINLNKDTNSALIAKL